MMKKIMEMFRVKEWYSSKIPLSVAMFVDISRKQKPNLDNYIFCRYLVGYFLFFVACAAYNYLFNDYSDLEVDKKAGKEKVIQNMKHRDILLSLILVCVLGCIPLWYVVAFNLKVIVVSIFVYLLGMAYSAKEIRLKERGIFGVIVSSFAQRNSSLLIIISLMKVNTLDLICWMLLVFINGLRYIFVHQLLDFENDKKSGVSTFVNKSKHSIKPAVVIAMVFEVIVASVLFIDDIVKTITMVLLLLYIITCILNSLFVKRVLHSSYFFSFSNLPFEDFYNVYLPLYVITIYGIMHQLYILIAISVLYLIVPLINKIGMPYMALKKLILKEL